MASSATLNISQAFAAAYNIDVDIADGAILLSDAVIGLSTEDVALANRALIATEGQACRISTVAGADPSSTDGVKYAAGSYIEVNGSQDIQNFKIIALVDNLTLQIILSK